MAAFVIGCSKSSKETPTVQFGSYIDATGNRVSGKASQATFEIKNPSESWVACVFHGSHDAVFTVQPNSTQQVMLHVGQTNAGALSVTLTQMRVVSSRELSVSIP